jgi:hypothetical protein
LGYIEIRLVERQWLDYRRVFGEDLPNFQRDRLVGVKPRLDKDQVGASPLGGDRRHRGMHAELPRFVACGRDDAAFARSADRDRLAAQLRIIALFDRCIERIHIDMDDFARAARPGRGSFCGPFRPHSEPSPDPWPGEDAVRDNRVLLGNR